MATEPTSIKKSPAADLRSLSAPIIERAPVPIVEVQGPKHILSYVNVAFCRLLGKTRTELLGHAFAEIVPVGDECVPILDKVYQTGEGTTHPVVSDSDPNPDQWLYAMWPALDANDRPVGVIIQLTRAALFRSSAAAMTEALMISGVRQHELTEVAEKVSEQLREEIAARKEANRGKALLASIVDSTADSIVSIDSNNLITSWNKAAEQLYGFAAGEVMGRSITMLTLPVDLQEVLARIEKVKQSQCVQLFETERIRKNGSNIFLSIQLSPIKDEEARVVGVSTVARDISERKQIEDALQKATAEISQHALNLEYLVAERTSNLQATISSLQSLTYTLAHDLRAPLRAMRGLTNALAEDVPMNEMGKNYAHRIHDAAGRMDQLLSDLLEYGQLSHLDFPIRQVDLKVPLAKILAEYSDEIATVGAEIQINELPPIMGNEILVEEVFSNLILNAIKFVPAGMRPKIFIKAETRGGMARIWVEDNGMGIEKEYHNKVFGVFQRLHTNEEYRGTGVGLAIVRRAAERMKGAVGVESQLGQGSRFWVELPLTDQRKK